MIARIKKKHFNCRQKVDSEFAATNMWNHKRKDLAADCCQYDWRYLKAVKSKEKS